MLNPLFKVGASIKNSEESKNEPMFFSQIHVNHVTLSTLCCKRYVRKMVFSWWFMLVWIQKRRIHQLAKIMTMESINRWAIDPSAWLAWYDPASTVADKKLYAFVFKQDWLDRRRHRSDLLGHDGIKSPCEAFLPEGRRFATTVNGFGEKPFRYAHPAVKGRGLRRTPGQNYRG